MRLTYLFVGSFDERLFESWAEFSVVCISIMLHEPEPVVAREIKEGRRAGRLRDIKGGREG